MRSFPYIEASEQRLLEIEQAMFDLGQRSEKLEAQIEKLLLRARNQDREIRKLLSVLAMHEYAAESARRFAAKKKTK
jgi:hypothetical protein